MPAPIAGKMAAVPRRSSSSRAATVGATLLGALVVLLPLARGGVDVWAQAVALVAALVALLLLAGGEVRLPWAGVALLGVCAAMALQVGAGLLLPGGRLASLDPPSTGRELAKGVAALAAFLAGYVAGPTGRRRDRVVLGLGVAGLAVAALVFGGALLGVTPLLEPRRPFVNPNHLSGFAALTAFPLLGLALRDRGQGRLLWLMGFMLVAAVAFLSLSRGGIGAFLGGSGLFVLLSLRREARPGEPSHRTRAVMVASLAAALAVVAYLALGPVLRELQTVRGAGDEVKLALWRPAAQMTLDRPLLGIGRGAFEVAFPSWKTQEENLTFTHLENEWLQPLVELGVPLGLLLVGTFLWLWLRAALRRDLSWVEVGLLSGTAALCAQNLVDFSLELVGLSIPFAVAMGLLQRGERGFQVGWLKLAAGSGVAALLAAGGLALWVAHPLEGEAAEVAQAPSAAAAEVRAREVARWHPVDWVPVATVGARWVGEGRCASALPWLTRAMQLNPTGPEPHLFAARCLAASGQAPAAQREYRLAFLFGRSDALSEAARWWPTVEGLLAVAPQSADGLLAAAGVLRGLGRKEEATEVLRRALDEYRDGRAVAPLAAAALEEMDPDQALPLARRREAEAPLDPDGWLLAAEALTRQGLADEAGAELEAGLARLPGSPPLIGAQVQRALAARRYSEAKRLAEGMAARTPTELAQRQAWVAAALASQGRLGEAIDRARSAVSALPEAAWPLQTLASYCEQAGRYDDAIAAVEHAAGLPGQAPGAWTERLEQLRAAKAVSGDRRLTEELLLRRP
jgi:tetratricopeptide (TPR) repeat protein/O-antigen ligase